MDIYKNSFVFFPFFFKQEGEGYTESHSITLLVF